MGRRGVDKLWGRGRKEGPRLWKLRVLRPHCWCSCGSLQAWTKKSGVFERSTDYNASPQTRNEAVRGLYIPRNNSFNSTMPQTLSTLSTHSTLFPTQRIPKYILETLETLLGVVVMVLAVKDMLVRFVMFILSSFF